MNALALQDPQWETLLTKIPKETVDPKDRPRLIYTLIGIAEGQSWSEIVRDGLSRPEYIMLRRRSKEFRSMAVEAEAVADEVKQSIREEEAHHRAVEGETIPVYTRDGKWAGEYQKRSDRLMEVLLKASNPKKYGDKKTEQVGGVILNLVLGIPSRVKTIEMKEVDHAEETRQTSSSDPTALEGCPTSRCGGEDPPPGVRSSTSGTGGGVSPAEGFFREYSDRTPGTQRLPTGIGRPDTGEGAGADPGEGIKEESKEESKGLRKTPKGTLDNRATRAPDGEEEGTVRSPGSEESQDKRRADPGSPGLSGPF